MGNKRIFKKSISSIGASICNEMMTGYYNIEGIDKDAVEKAIATILAAMENARISSNIFFDRGPRGFADVKEYSAEKKRFFRALFNKISSDFSASVDEALNIYNKAVPEEVKRQNKELINND